MSNYTWFTRKYDIEYDQIMDIRNFIWESSFEKFIIRIMEFNLLQDIIHDNVILYNFQIENGMALKFKKLSKKEIKSIKVSLSILW